MKYSYNGEMIDELKSRFFLKASTIGEYFRATFIREKKIKTEIWEEFIQINKKLREIDDQYQGNNVLEVATKLCKSTNMQDVICGGILTCHQLLGLHATPTQVLCTLAMLKQSVAEMKTGEGKTLAGIIYAITYTTIFKRQLIIATANDYLSKRDFEYSLPVMQFLNIPSVYISPQSGNKSRKYKTRLIYVNISTFAFDYLGGFLKSQKEEILIKKLDDYSVLLDEADYAAIDCANIPFTISSGSNSNPINTDIIEYASSIARSVPIEHIVLDMEKQSAYLDSRGWEYVKEKTAKDGIVKGEIISDRTNTEIFLHYLSKGLSSRMFLNRGQQYGIVGDKVVVIDEHTGRIEKGRNFSHGVNQAIEAMEGITVTQPSVTIATIGSCIIFRKCKMVGMTGTAYTSAEELFVQYGAPTVRIPTFKENKLQKLPNIFCHDRNTKIETCLQLIKERHGTGQPILVGCIVTEESDIISAKLDEMNIAHKTLNAFNQEKEVEIIDVAGKLKAVTISTSMAGRGTDIKLTKESKEAGGLFVICCGGTSFRGQNQLIGRAARQGDPGLAQMIISADDQICVYKKHHMQKLVPGILKQGDLAYRVVSKMFKECQELRDSDGFASRKQQVNNLMIFDNLALKYWETRYKILSYTDKELVEFLHGKASELLEKPGALSKIKEVIEIEGTRVEDTMMFIENYLDTFLQTSFLIKLDIKAIRTRILEQIKQSWSFFITSYTSISKTSFYGKFTTSNTASLTFINANKLYKDLEEYFIIKYLIELTHASLKDSYIRLVILD